MKDDIQTNLKYKAFSNVVWKFLERFLAQGVSLVVSIVLARILLPEDYSVVSLVTIFFVFANVLISGGLNTALIQKKDADIEDYSTILHISVLIAVATYIILFFTAPFLSALFNQPSFTLIVRIMALVLPINAVKSIWTAYISSNLKFKKFFFATLGGTLFSAIIGIVLALKGFGPWALVAQQMSNAVVDTIILIATTRIKILPKISFSKFKSLFGYGWKILVSGLIGAAYTEFVPLIIGIKYNKTDLSYYTKGKSFPAVISQTINNTLSAVLFPVLSKKQEDKQAVLEYTRKFIRISSFVVVPIMLGFFAISDNFVYTILTEKWMDSSFYIKLFCIVALFDVIAIGNCETIKAIGRSGVYLIIEIIKKISYFVIIFLFVFLTPNPRLLAISAIACTVVQLLVNSIPNKFLINYKFTQQLADLLPNLLIGAIMCLAVLLVKYTDPEYGIMSLIKQVLIGISFYFALAFATRNKSLYYLIGVIKGFAKKSV